MRTDRVLTIIFEEDGIDAVRERPGGPWTITYPWGDTETIEGTASTARKRIYEAIKDFRNRKQEQQA